MILLHLDGELIGEFAKASDLEKYIKDNNIDVEGKNVRFDCGD